MNRLLGNWGLNTLNQESVHFFTLENMIGQDSKSRLARDKYVGKMSLSSLKG